MRRGRPAVGSPAGAMVTALAPMRGTHGMLATLQAACDALHAAPEELESIAVSGRLPQGSTALPLLARAETLGREFQLSVHARLDRTTYDIRFLRLPELERR